VATTPRAALGGLLLLGLIASPAWANEEMLCPGTVVPLVLSGTHSPYVRTSLSGEAGYFQIDTGSAISTVDGGLFRRPVGAAVLLDDFAFPTVSRGKFIALNFAAIPSLPGGRQIGQIGTNVLRHRTTEFHYEATPPYLVISDQPCSAEKLQAAGFVPISQHGYFGGDTSRLGRIADNTPVAFIRVGSVTIPAWIDTGFVETNSAGTVQVNEAALENLRTAGVALAPAGSGSGINCTGERLDMKLWRVVGAPMSITTEQGRSLFTYSAPLLAMLPRNPCGGPGNASVPVARIGAAYVNWWGTFVLDALNERVWLSPTRARAPERSVTRRAMVVAASRDGGVTISTGNTLAATKATALATCGKYGGPCTVKISIDPSEVRCIAMARNKEKTAKPALVERTSIDDAKKAALDECSRTTRGSCAVQVSECNG
jgi:hypothetical protein